ncbi:MAG: serine/threonine protein kinase [Actinomycetales bacterium]
MGEVLAGRYELVDPIGSGGSGSVWRVWDHAQGRYRAAKLLRHSDADSLVRFVRETSRRIEHTHVVAPDGWYGEDDRVLLTMPLVRGGSLATLLSDNGPLPMGYGIAVLRQLLQALDAIHAVGLVHRDLKPGNVLLEPTGTRAPHLRVADFGTAAEISAPRLTQAGYAIGTLGYMSPEQLRGEDPDPRQDLYAAAMVAVESFTGLRPPPQGPPPGVELDGPAGGAVSELLTAMSSPDPRARPATAAEALSWLDSIPDSHDLTLGQDPANPVEVFEQLAAPPQGWGSHGPDPGAPSPVRLTGHERGVMAAHPHAAQPEPARLADPSHHPGAAHSSGPTNHSGATPYSGPGHPQEASAPDTPTNPWAEAPNPTHHPGAAPGGWQPPGDVSATPHPWQPTSGATAMPGQPAATGRGIGAQPPGDPSTGGPADRPRRVPPAAWLLFGVGALLLATAAGLLALM